MRLVRLATLAAIGGAVVVAVVATSCKPDPKGALVIAVDSDHTPGVDFDRFQIQITSSNSNDKYDNPVDELGRPGLLTFPTTLSIVSNDDPSTSVHIRVLTGRASGGGTRVGAPRTLREVVTNVPADRVALLHLTIDWLCVGAAKPEPDGYVEGLCPEGLTCIAGQCVDWTIDAATLPAYDESEVFGGGSRRGDGECFDTLACFSQGAIADVSLDDCSVALPAGGPGANVALVLAPSEGGICLDATNGPCLVPLTSGAREGYRVAGDRALLPRAACDRLAEAPDVRKVIGVATTAACATKTERLPTCGPWSPYRRALGAEGAPAGYSPPPPRDAGHDG
jgi:hypothetical protein